MAQILPAFPAARLCRPQAQGAVRPYLLPQGVKLRHALGQTNTRPDCAWALDPGHHPTSQSMAVCTSLALSLAFAQLESDIKAGDVHLSRLLNHQRWIRQSSQTIDIG